MLSGKLCRQSSALYLKRVRLDSADRVDEDAWIFQTIRHVEVPTNRSCVQWSQHSFQQTDFPLSQLSSQDLFAWKRFEQTPMLFYPSLKEQVWYGEEDFSKNYHLCRVYSKCHCEDYPQLLGAVRQNFAKIKDEFLKSYEHRGGKLSALEEEHLKTR